MTPPKTPDDEPDNAWPADPASALPPPHWLSGSPDAGLPPNDGELLPPTPSEPADPKQEENTRAIPAPSAPPPLPHVQPAPRADETIAEPTDTPEAPEAASDADATFADKTVAEPLPSPRPAPPPPPFTPGPPAPTPLPWEDPAAALPPFDPQAVFGSSAPGVQEPPPTPPPPMPPVGETAPPGPSIPPRQAIPPPQIQEPWRVQQPKRTRRFRPALLIAAVAGAAAVALVAAGGVYLLGRNSESTTASGGARLAGAIFPAAPGAATDGRAQVLNAVAAGGTTVVAVGGESDPLDIRGQFLVSTDGGRTFTSARVENAEGQDPGPAEVPRLVAASAAGWIAIGDRPGGPAIWSSADGRTWRREADELGAPFADRARVSRLIGTGNGFVAVGATSEKGDFSDAKAALWVSPDGKRWELRHGDGLGLKVNKGTLTMVDVASSGPMLIAMGLHQDGRKQVRLAWVSKDGGTTWQSARIPAPKGTVGLSIGAGERGLVAVRDVRSGSTVRGQVFISADGGAWSQAGRIETPGYQGLFQVTASDQGYTAVVRGAGNITLARSADGLAWTPAGTVPLGPGLTLTGAATAGGQTVLVGGDGSGPDPDAMLAVRDAGGAAVPVDLTKIEGAVDRDHRVTGLGAGAGRLVAVGSAAGDATVWSSADGNTWSNVHTARRPGLQSLLGVTSGGRGWVAVGMDQGERTHPLVLTSTDGTRWEDSDANPAFTASSGQQLVTQDAAAGQAGYVIVGADESAAATWYSSDLKNWERGVGADRNDLIAPDGGAHWMKAVTAGQSGFVAAGGADDVAVREGPRDRPAVWTSPNGRTWRQHKLPLPSGVRNGSLSDVQAMGNTIVAIGTGFDDKGRVPLAYVSADGGASWKAAGVRAPAGDSDVGMTTITAATGNGFAATGTAGRPGTSDVVSWSSPDGQTWTAQKAEGTGLSGGGDQQITGLAFHQGALVAVGRLSDQRGQEPVLWRRPAK
ncbi:sialidase family protein [Actinomadura sp. NBRC 104412]|uniref:sialidase family protein n=1 Tax=Actinomadura sp. NBRC 104412 TaxID=3032203 RepID=UPI0025561142|nr:sialidase family protein [Actinomadura sp. NBRC 104412]